MGAGRSGGHEGGGGPLVVAPKVETPEAVHALSAGLAKGCALWAMIETPRALMALADIASADGALEG